MQKQKWFRVLLFSVLALLLANVLHALFLYQKSYEDVSIKFTVSSDYDSFVWLSLQPKFSETVHKFESIKVIRDTPQEFKKTISSKDGIQFLGLYWSNSDNGTLTLRDVSITTKDKTHDFKNLQKLVDYTSTNVTSQVSENNVQLTSSQQANGWLMLDTSQLEKISKQKQFLPFRWLTNIVLFIVFLLVGRLKYDTIKIQARALTISGTTIYKLRLLVLYAWLALLPFWLMISHLLLALSLALAIGHYIKQKEHFQLGNLKKVSSFIALFFVIFLVDVFFFPTEITNDLGDFSYFLLTPFLFLGIEKVDLLKIFRVFQIALFGYVVLLVAAIFERYTQVEEPYSYLSFFFETIELYWHTSYLASLIVIALLFQILVYKLTPFYIFTCALAFVFLYISQARLPFFIGAVILIAITFSRLPAKRKRIYAAIVIVIALTTSFYIVYSKECREKLIASVLVNDAQKTDARIQLWEAGVAIFIENPWDGIGRSFVREELSERLDFSSDIKNRRYNAHNQYLEFLIAYGIFVPVILLIVLSIPIIFRLKTAVVFSIYFSLAMLVESYFSRQSGVVIFSLFYCFFILYDCKDKQHTQVSSQ